MNKRMCQVEHNPPHTYGDCIRACVATLIDRDDVPHTYNGGSPVKAWQDLREYLKLHGKTLSLFEVTEPFFTMAENNPDIPYMLLCKTANADHAVVCKNDVVIHDPSHAKSEIIGEHSLGCWIVCIIGNI